MNSRRFFCCVVAVLAVGGVGRAAESLRIVPIVRDQSLIVSVELADAYTDEVRQAIASGVRTTFTYDLELRMDVPAWVDRTIATAEVSTTDQYDTLARIHHLSRMVDGRVEEALVTEDDALARRWLVALNGLPLCRTSKLDPHHEYYVRISAHVRPLGASLLGWATAITNQAKFTFIP
jgi:Domain of unknown function (DUF4390)